MKETMTIYLYGCPKALDKNIENTDLVHNYDIVGNGFDINNLYNLKPSSIDYLIVFAGRNKVDNLVKNNLNYLNQIFNHIVVVGESHINVLGNYIYIPRQLINNKLYWILKVLENGLDRPVKLNYKKFCLSAYEVLDNLGFNINHKGYDYIVICAYNLAITNGKINLRIIYRLLAQIYNSSICAIERCIRFAIESTQKNSISNLQQNLPKLSNKQFIVMLNQLIEKDLMK